jgi:hypothetical protein
MTKQSLINLLLVSSCLILACADGLPQAGTSKGSGARILTSGAPAAGARPVAEWRYTLTARVRLVVFWISCAGVGGARISSTADGSGNNGLELLIGSDPDRTPMRINRWGYVSEQAAGRSAKLVGIMTAADEKSVEQARVGVTHPPATQLYKAIRGNLDNGVASSAIARAPLRQEFTYRNLDEVLRIFPWETAATRRSTVPDGIEPGFLFAVQSLMRDSMTRCRSGVTGNSRPQRTYVYDATLFRLTRTSTRAVPKVAVNGREYRHAIESEFEATDTTTGRTTSFSILHGTAEEMPIRIVYRPRWWFEAELLLEPGPGQMAGGVPCKAGLD